MITVRIHIEVVRLDFLDRAITKFCYKHPKFGIRNLMLGLALGTVAVYLIDMMDTTNKFLTFLDFDPALILKGQVWRLVTPLLIPSDLFNPSSIGGKLSPFFLIISLYFYYSIGSSLERKWGTGRFTIYYLSGWLFCVIFGFILHLCEKDDLAELITANYLNLSLFLAFAVLWPDHVVLLMFILPVKMKWLAWVDAAFLVVNVIQLRGDFPFNLLPVAAILNFLLFCGPSLLKNLLGDRRVSQRRAAFRTNVRRSEQEQQIRAYRHKCAVCGRTDRTNPELEFRYCSRCQGYHCFCQDHINNHIHFTE